MAHERNSVAAPSGIDYPLNNLISNLINIINIFDVKPLNTNS